MLVLSRKEDQVIVIDGRIRVTVVAIRGSQVRLGIEAPKYPTLDERLQAIWLQTPEIERKCETNTDVRRAMRTAYLAGREDEKYNVRIDT